MKVSQLSLIRSVRFVQVVLAFWYVRVKGQIEYAIRKDGTIPNAKESLT